MCCLRKTNKIGHIQSAHWNKLPSPSSVWRVSSWDKSFWSVVKVTCYQWVEEGEARKCKKSCFELRPPLLFCATSFLGSILTKIIILDRLWMHLYVVTPPVENTWKSFSNNSFDELVLFLPSCFVFPSSEVLLPDHIRTFLRFIRLTNLVIL